MREAYRRVPALQRLSRAFIYSLVELLLAPGMTRDRRYLKPAEWIVKLKLRREVPDPEPATATDARLPARLQAARLLERVVSGAPGAERRPRELRHPRGARALDRGRGRRRARDRHAHPRDRLHARRAAHRGADPRTRRPLARRGLGRQPAGVSGHDRHRLPEPHLPLRPQPEPGPHSIVYMLESQLAYAIDALRTMRLRGAAEFEVRPEVQAAYNEELQERLAGTVWNTAAAAAGTSTATAATRSCGPATRSSTAAARATSTPRRTASARPLP